MNGIICGIAFNRRNLLYSVGAEFKNPSLGIPVRIRGKIRNGLT